MGASLGRAAGARRARARQFIRRRGRRTCLKTPVLAKIFQRQTPLAWERPRRRPPPATAAAMLAAAAAGTLPARWAPNTRLLGLSFSGSAPSFEAVLLSFPVLGRPAGQAPSATQSHARPPASSGAPQPPPRTRAANPRHTRLTPEPPPRPAAPPPSRHTASSATNPVALPSLALQDMRPSARPAVGGAPEVADGGAPERVRGRAEGARPRAAGGERWAAAAAAAGGGWRRVEGGGGGGGGARARRQAGARKGGGL